MDIYLFSLIRRHFVQRDCFMVRLSFRRSMDVTEGGGKGFAADPGSRVLDVGNWTEN